MSIQYQEIKVMRDHKNQGKVVVECGNNTFVFWDCTMDEIALFVRKIMEEGDKDR